MSERSNATIKNQHKDVYESLNIIEEQLDYLIKAAEEEDCEALASLYQPIKTNVLLASIDIHKLC